MAHPEVQGDSAKTADTSDYVLIISSYTNDSKRYTDFAKDIAKEWELQDVKLETKTEYLNIIGFNRINTWHANIKEILAKQDTSKLKSIILVGQEAWSIYLSINYELPKVPFFGVLVSQFGIKIPEYVDDINTWKPQSVDTRKLAEQKGQCGALFNYYDFEENIKFILKLYPDIKEIGFMSDNTYGGVSLQSRFDQVMKSKFPGLKPVILDGKRLTLDEMKETVAEGGNQIAILLGSWRINNHGSYYQNTTMGEIVSSRPDIPLFTITGIGFELNTIGGYVPSYEYDPGIIVKKIKNFVTTGQFSNTFVTGPSNYRIKMTSFNHFNLNKNDIPPNAIIEDSFVQKIQQYQTYIIVESVSLALIICLLIAIRRQNSKLKKQSEELRVAKEEAVKSDKLKSAFLANISHEIRTPLNAIVGFSALINDADENNRNVFQKIINESSVTLLELVDQIVELSKVEANTMVIVRKEFNMKTMMRDLYNKLMDSKPENVEFTLHESNISNTNITYDKYHLEKLISKLVSNSFKFTSSGFVKVSYQITNSGITVKVADSGIGIRKEDQGKIFERFEKLNQFTQGTGLGLSIAKAIVEKSEGTIELESQPGKGTTFTVSIPCKTEAGVSETQI